VVVVAGMVVVVAADVEVEVEETGAQLAVVVPVASGLPPEAKRADGREPQREIGCPARCSNGRVAKSPHHLARGSVLDPAAQSAN
jgi:hypothetical protein